MIDIEVTIWTVDGILPYRRDRMNQAASYSPWRRQVKSFPSLRKKIAEYQEEKRSFNPFTQVRETNFGKKRSRRSKKSKRLDVGHFTPFSVASTCPTTTTTTTMLNLSAPSNLPSILNITNYAQTASTH